MKAKLGSILFAAVLVVIGLVSGWFAAHQGDTPQSGEEGAGAGAPELSEQTLKNLGVTLGRVELTEFTRTVSVQSAVQDAPQNARPVPALVGGVVTKLHVRTGEVVGAGDPLVTLARAPIERPKLELTGEILQPAREGLHGSIARLRVANAQAAIVNRELARIRSYAPKEGELPILPRKQLIDLEYELARVEQERENAEHELAWHGLSKEEIEAVRRGDPPPPSPRLWRRALERNSLWGETEDALFAALPEPLRTRPWSVAAIGELSAAGLASPDLVAAMNAEVELSRHFIEAASLILEGHSLAQVTLLAASGSLEPETVLRAPPGEWDVERLTVRPGERVPAGAVVALLHDARTMWLRLEPVGDEAGLLAGAFERGASLRARPLVAGSGPDLDGLRIDRLATRPEDESRGTVGYVIVKNEALPGPDGETRSWRLRVGLRYLVAVPVAEPKPSFVLPASAVTDLGPERIVYLRDGDTFRSVPVHIEYLDDEIAVIANDGALFEKDMVALTGAFALGLALQEEGGGVDPHAGHNHG